MLGASSVVAEFRLVEDGLPNAAILLPEHATATEEYAAAELQGVINRITEVVLPVYREGAAPGTPFLIRIGTPGTSSHIAGLKSDLALTTPQQEHDRYTAKVIGNTLYLVGNTPSGALYATYAFLHEIGCRWYWPGPDGEYLPRKLPEDLGAIDMTSAPAFSRRGYHLCSIWAHHDAPTETWMARNLMNYVAWTADFHLAERKKKGFHEFVWGGHILDAPFRGMFEKHPEYFSLIGGERVPDSQPCLSNPEVKDIFVKWVEEFWAGHPGISRLNIFGIDNSRWCECEDCRAMDDPREPNDCVSTRFFTFLNEVIERVDRKYPDKQYQTIAYWNYLAPPYVRPNKKLVIGYCLYGRCFRHGFESDCPAMAAARKRIEEWQKFGNPMYMYGYHFDLFTGKVGVRIPIAYLIADELRYLKRRGFMGWFTEVAPPNNRPGREPYEDFWTCCRFPLYAAARLLWDPDRKVDEIRADWCRRVFGRAAEPMRRYYRGIEDAWRSAGHFSGILKHPASFAGFITPERQKEFLRCFSEAEEALAKERNGRVWARCNRQVQLEKQILMSWLRLRSSKRVWRGTARVTSKAPAVDGKPDDPCWRGEPQIKDFVDAGGNPVADQTEVHLAYTDRAMYLLCVCYDREIRGLVAQHTEHDSQVWADDSIELFLDPEFTRGDYYHLAINPRGALWDAKVGVGFQVDPAWNGKWRAQASVADDRWFVEIELPFETFGKGGPEHPWLMGINRSRGGRKGCANSSWTDGTYHNPQAFGVIVFEP